MTRSFDRTFEDHEAVAHCQHVRRREAVAGVDACATHDREAPYVANSDELVALVIDSLVAEAKHGIRWPKGWRAVLSLYAHRLDALVRAHPAMIEAYGRDVVHSEASSQITREILERLIANGLTVVQATQAYVGVHALVLGAAVLRPSLQEAEVPVQTLIETFLDGVAAGAGSSGPA